MQIEYTIGRGCSVDFQLFVSRPELWANSRCCEHGATSQRAGGFLVHVAADDQPDLRMVPQQPFEFRGILQADPIDPRALHGNRRMMQEQQRVDRYLLQPGSQPGSDLLI